MSTSTKRVLGARIPKIQGVASEVTQYTVQSEFLHVKKNVSYSVTLEQHLFIKSHGGSEFLRDLITWFAEQEKQAVTNNFNNGTEDFCGFSFGGVPVLVDKKTRTPLWETYFWAKHNQKTLQETIAKFKTN